MADVIELVTLAVVTDPKTPDDQPSMVIAYDVDETGPSITWDITTDLNLGRNNHGALLRLGVILHHLADILLSDRGVVLDLHTPTTQGGATSS